MAALVTAPGIRCGFVLMGMRILVNGQAMEVAEGLTLVGLLALLGVRRQFTAVALNREVARKGSYATTVLRAADRVEIVHPMAGG